MGKFQEKIEVAGNVVTISAYTRPQVSGKARPPRDPSLVLSKEEQARRRQKNRQRTLYRARKRYYDLVNLNFSSLNKFLTLTIANPLYVSREIANPGFKRFIDLLRKTHDKDLKYIAAIERQQRGVIHYHLLMDLRYIPFTVLLKKWKIGGAWIKAIPPGCHDVAGYMSKYMAKDLSQDGDGRVEAHKKIFLRSRNLLYPPLVGRGDKGQFTGQIRELRNSLSFAGREGDYDLYKGENEHLGKYQIHKICMDRNSTSIEAVKKEVEWLIEASLVQYQGTYPSQYTQ